MKHAKRIVAALLTLVVAAGGLPVAANARDVRPDNLSQLIPADLNPEELRPLVELAGEPDNVQAPALPENEPAAVTSGTCGENLTWSYDNTYLTISGTGDMYDYSEENPAPWNDRCGSIYTITLEDGVTSIGNEAFSGCFRLNYVYITSAVTSIGSKAFYDCSGGQLYFLGETPEFQADSFSGYGGWTTYFRPWDESDLQNYGGEPRWERGRIDMSWTCQQLYQLNEPIDVQELEFRGSRASSPYNHNFHYVPGEVIIGEYDNSTFGQKSVDLTVDGIAVTYNYYVTDGSNHLDTITVEYEQVYEYVDNKIFPQPVVRAGDVLLEKGVNYSVEYNNDRYLGSENTFTITGNGIFEGFVQTYPFTIVKKDLSSEDISVYVYDADFYGIPTAPEVIVRSPGLDPKEGEDYQVIYEDNVNIGTGTVRVVGIGGYCGTTTQTFQINKKDTTLYLDGEFIGNAADGELNDDYYYQEGLLSPGVLTARIDVGYYHAAYYALYRIVGEDAELVTEYEPDPGTSGKTKFTYDFTDVYNSDNPDGGEVYMLVYSWMNDDYAVFSGVCVMYVPSKVSAATAMTMGQLMEDSDFRRDYLTVFGNDGVLGDVTWTSSDEALTTVTDGNVTLKKPGTVTVTAQSGGLTVSADATITALDLTEAEIFNYDTVNQTANVIYDAQILQPRTDYTLSAQTQDGVTEVTAEGLGLFAGQIVRYFDAATGQAIGHTHTFDNTCDASCGSCDFTRPSGHRYGDQWVKDQDGHWHGCAVCGDKSDYAEHTFTADDHCAVCGTLYTPGDLNCNFTVNEDDAIYLLQHVLLPDFFPVDQNVDYNHDSQINEDDAIYLLQHVLLPEFFPL